MITSHVASHVRKEMIRTTIVARYERITFARRYPSALAAAANEYSRLRGEPSSRALCRKSTCCYAKQRECGTESAHDIKPPIKRSISASLLPVSLCTVFIITSGERKTTGRERESEREGREGKGRYKRVPMITRSPSSNDCATKSQRRRRRRRRRR